MRNIEFAALVFQLWSGDVDTFLSLLDEEYYFPLFVHPVDEVLALVDELLQTRNLNNRNLKIRRFAVRDDPTFRVSI